MEAVWTRATHVASAVQTARSCRAQELLERVAAFQRGDWLRLLAEMHHGSAGRGPHQPGEPATKAERRRLVAYAQVRRGEVAHARVTFVGPVPTRRDDPPRRALRIRPTSCPRSSTSPPSLSPHAIAMDGLAPPASPVCARISTLCCNARFPSSFWRMPLDVWLAPTLRAACAGSCSMRSRTSGHPFLMRPRAPSATCSRPGGQARAALELHPTARVPRRPQHVRYHLTGIALHSTPTWRRNCCLSCDCLMGLPRSLPRDPPGEDPVLLRPTRRSPGGRALMAAHCSHTSACGASSFTYFDDLYVPTRDPEHARPHDAVVDPQCGMAQGGVAELGEDAWQRDKPPAAHGLVGGAHAQRAALARSPPPVCLVAPTTRPERCCRTTSCGMPRSRRTPQAEGGEATRSCQPWSLNSLVLETFEINTVFSGPLATS
ncbi:unnamed protein product [Symbiodinium natans]|uniref:Uncharacterized protein n=1 Tax=Symbiodinium natans TaxID=878477 RepID=A0A812R1I6_9DINO|nr:unnamed protein product [Symbiodinium natans]